MVSDFDKFFENVQFEVDKQAGSGYQQTLFSPVGMTQSPLIIKNRKICMNSPLAIKEQYFSP